jgi:hypothetical protein
MKRAELSAVELSERKRNFPAESIIIAVGTAGTFSV